MQNTWSQLSIGDDGLGESDLESNLVTIQDYQDGGESVNEGHFLLPADSWKDLNMLDWVLSMKSVKGDESADLFNDLMMEQFVAKSKTGGVGYVAMAIARGSYDKVGSDSTIDRLIEKDDKSIESNLAAMKEFYGEKQLEDMTPAEFYSNYKKFAAGLTF